MANLFELGVSALNASKTALTTTGHNISNASTPGYSRQEALQTTPLPEKAATGYVGTGVTLDGVRRMVDQFLEDELRVTASSFKQFEMVVSNAEQLDNLLGDETTSLSPSLERFFGAMHDVADNPQSTATRQMLLSEANLLAGRFESVSNRLDDQNKAINTQMKTTTTELNALAVGIAELNQKIVNSQSATQNAQPNDLLDKRDHLILQMSELVSVNTVRSSDGAVNVFIGNGQGLVVGNRSFQMDVAPGENDPTRYDVIFRQGSANLRITNSLVGGELGGLISYRDNVLDPTYNQLGLVAMGLNVAVNEQHRRGMDLDNEVGGDFFTAINATQRMRDRVVDDPDNAFPADGVIEVAIDDVGQLTTSDYTLTFTGASAGTYQVRRESDHQVVAQGTFSGVFPSSVEADGMTISLVSGTFQPGDRFTLQPTRRGATELNMEIDNVRDLALAQPIRAKSATGNRGTGVISQGEVLDTRTQAFTSSGLNPPLMIQFTSPTTYDVLDYSDPASPVALVPPMNNRTFVPGIENKLFSENENENGVTSDGTAIGVPVNLNASNGYPAETLRFTTVDPGTGVISTQTANTNADDTAQTIAQTLNALTGVTATASTYAVVSNIRSNSPMNLTLNGELLSGTNPDALADSINNNAVLTQQGMIASSDGSQLTVRSSQGVDFVFQVGGGSAGDSIDLTGPGGAQLTVTGANATPAATIGGTVDLVLDEGVTVQGAGGLFSILPTHTPAYKGFQVTLSGHPADDDTFLIEYNTNGFADNRNALALARIQKQPVLTGGAVTIQDSYAGIVNTVGTRTQESTINKEAAEVLYQRAQTERSEISGVNLDEEAANLIEFEQAYNAAAQLISVARSLFDSLLGAVR